MQLKLFLNRGLVVALLALYFVHAPDVVRCVADDVAEPDKGERRQTLQEWKQRIMTSTGDARRAHVALCLRRLPPFEIVSLLEQLDSDAGRAKQSDNERTASIEALSQFLSGMGVIEADREPPPLDDLRRTVAAFRAGVTTQSAATRKEADIEQEKTGFAKAMIAIREQRHVGAFVSAAQELFRRWPPLGANLKDLESLTQTEWSRTGSTAKWTFEGLRSSATISVTLDIHDNIRSVEFTLGG